MGCKIGMIPAWINYIPLGLANLGMKGSSNKVV
nr:MAG TPA: hypothetical protein [Caudoviricetes sp.]